MLRKCFEPFYIGKVRLKNRIAMLPMGDGLQADSRGVSDQEIAYFTARARGGAGLIFQASNPLNNHSLQGWNIDIDDRGKLQGLNKLTRAVHSYGAKMGVMLGLGFGGCFPNPDGSMPKTPCKMPLKSDPSLETEPFTNAEIYTLIDQYGQSAYLAQLGGYDMVHVQGYGSYLIDMFTCEKWNWREDEFGGSFENRMRFPRLLIEAIQKYCGRDFPIVYKFSPIHLIPGGRTMEEGIRFAKLLESWGAAALHVDVGSFPETVYELIPPVYLQYRARQFDAAKIIKQNVGIPVFTQGKIGDPCAAEAVLREGCTDLIALGRSWLADPEWANKLREDRVEDIRPCICCCTGCLGHINENEGIGCAVNPMTGLENSVLPGEPTEKKRVLVIGAGPGGCAASLYAARRGHEVELWEKTSQIGGQLIPASAPAFKHEMRRLTEYYKAQIYKTPNIRLRLNVEATAEAILQKNPDVVLLATGSVEKRPPVPGIERALLARDVLCERVRLGKNVVVIGGGYVGAETAVQLDRSSKNVTLVEALPQLLSEKAAWQTEAMMRAMLDASEIRILTDTRLVSVEADGVCVQRGDRLERIPADSVVLAVGSRSNNALEKELAGKLRLEPIGDALTPGKILDAVWQAHAATLTL